jgi:hypothetical protein
MLVSNEEKAVVCRASHALLCVSSKLYVQTYTQSQQICLREDLSTPETISNVKASQGAHKLTTKLLSVSESSPVAILETDNSASFSFLLCAVCIFYSTILAPSFL